jgi:hypothetical protein
MYKDKKSKMSRMFFLSMCDVKIFLTFTSPNMVLLWQLFYLFCSFLRHTLTKKTSLTFFLTSLSLYIFTIWKCIAYNFFCRVGIYFDKILVSEYKLFKRSNKANLFIALVFLTFTSPNMVLLWQLFYLFCSCI